MKDNPKNFIDERIPNPDQIYELVAGGWKANILRTAIHLDIFTIIANGLTSVKSITATKHWAKRPTRVLLDSLCALGFLEKKDNEYNLTPISATFLVSNKKTYAGGYVLTALADETWQQLTDAVRTGQHQIPNACSPEFAAVWEQDATIESMRTSRIDESLTMWRTVGIEPDKKERIRVLDLASGCGIKSFVLAKHNPNAEITCIDWSGVLKVAEQLADKWGILKQINFKAEDVLTMNYGESNFDAVLLGQITDYWSVEQNKSIFKKIYRTLAQNGIVVIHCPCADEERCRAKSLVTAVVIFLFSKEGDIYTFSEYKSMLMDAGFTKITKHNDFLISARK